MIPVHPTLGAYHKCHSSAYPITYNRCTIALAKIRNDSRAKRKKCSTTSEVSVLVNRAREFLKCLRFDQAPRWTLNQPEFTSIFFSVLFLHSLSLCVYFCLPCYQQWVIILSPLFDSNSTPLLSFLFLVGAG